MQRGGERARQEIARLRIGEHPARLLFQRAATVDGAALGYSQEFNAQVERAPAERLARYVGRLRVEIAGPLTPDSLNRLLEQVQPLR